MFFLKARTDISEEKAVMRRDVSEKWGSRIDYNLFDSFLLLRIQIIHEIHHLAPLALINVIIDVA